MHFDIGTCPRHQIKHELSAAARVHVTSGGMDGDEADQLWRQFKETDQAAKRGHGLGFDEAATYEEQYQEALEKQYPGARSPAGRQISYVLLQARARMFGRTRCCNVTLTVRLTVAGDVHAVLALRVRLKAGDTKTRVQFRLVRTGSALKRSVAI